MLLHIIYIEVDLAFCGKNNTMKNKQRYLLKVVYLLEHFPRKVSQTFVVNEMVELMNLGVDIQVAAFSSDSAIHASIKKSKLMNNLVKIYGSRSKLLRFMLLILNAGKCLFVTPSLFFKIVFMKKKGYSFNELFHALVAVPKIKKINDISCLHVPFPSAALISLCEIVKFIYHIPFTATYRAGEVYSSVSKQKYSEHCDCFITISNYNKENLKNIVGSRVDFKVVHSSINIELFSPVEKKASETWRIVSVGRFIPKKGISVLIEAAALLVAKGHDINVSLVGEGPLEGEYKRLIDHYSLTHCISIISALPNEEIKNFLATQDLFVLPCVIDSTGDRDILPNVLKEAMAMEVPVVTSNVAGIEELVEDGLSGLLVEPHDSQGVCDAIERVMVDSQLYSTIKKNGREKISKDFNVKSESRKMKEIFEAVCL